MFAVSGATAAAQQDAPVAVPTEQATPRAVFQAFLERMKRNDQQAAAELLDLSNLPAEARVAKGPELAYRLYETMQRLAELPGGEGWSADNWAAALEEVPLDPVHPEPWSLAQLGSFTEEGAELIKIVRLADSGRWAFSSETVKLIEDLFDETEDLAPLNDLEEEEQPTKPIAIRYRELFPETLRKKHFLMPTYQWLSLLAIAVIARLAELAGRRTLTVGVDNLLGRYDADFKETTAAVWKPVGRLTNAACWYGGAFVLGLPYQVVGFLLVVLKLVTLVTGVWAAMAVIRLVSEYTIRHARRTDRRFDDLFVPVAATTARVVVVIAAVLLATAAFSRSLPFSLLGGLGIGGIAIALASQETLSNFFGSITVLFDRPFEVGDWVVVEGIEGEVEHVGFRSTRIRTGTNSQVTLPNSKLAAAPVDNWGRRKYRRYLTRLGVEYSTTPDQLEAFCEGVRELIRRQPHTRKDFYAAYFNDFGDSALEVLLVVYFEAPDWPTELRERHRLLADILRLAERLGVGFAFPTQTVHLHRGQQPEPPPEVEQPNQTGQLHAAQIAGELPNYQDRPGKVKFTGPTQLPPQET